VSLQSTLVVFHVLVSVTVVYLVILAQRNVVIREVLFVGKVIEETWDINI